MTLKPAMTFGQWKETSFIVITSNLEFSQVYVPKEETFPSRLTYIDVTRATYTHLDVLQGSRIYDYWNVDVDRNLFNENLSKGCMWSGGRLSKIQETARPEYLWPEIGPARQKQLRRRRSRNGQLKNRSSILLET